MTTQLTTYLAAQLAMTAATASSYAYEVSKNAKDGAELNDHDRENLMRARLSFELALLHLEPWTTTARTVALPCDVCSRDRGDTQLGRRWVMPWSRLCGPCYASSLQHAEELRAEVTR